MGTCSFWKSKWHTRHVQKHQRTVDNPFPDPWVLCSQTLWTTLGKTLTGNLITVWFRSSNSAYRPLSVEFLIYSNTCSHCGTETKGLLYPRQKRLRDLERFAHCLACRGWLDYCPGLDELSADTMYVSQCVAPHPVTLERSDTVTQWNDKAALSSCNMHVVCFPWHCVKQSDKPNTNDCVLVLKILFRLPVTPFSTCYFCRTWK